MTCFERSHWSHPMSNQQHLLLRAAALFAAIQMLGCGRDEIRASDYETSCTGDADCMLIQVGECTHKCGWAYDYAAINISDAESYQSHRDEIDCGRGSANCMVPPRPSGAVCTDGICATDP
jgi:hypothetical protein